MKIDESKIIEENNEDLAIACLLVDGICQLNNIGGTTCIYVNASDMFAWGCSDVEPIAFADGDDDSEIIALYKLSKENTWGFCKWLCLKRNMQPQQPVKDRMINAGYWDDTLEALPENSYGKAWREYHQSKLAQK